jgi:hypothetical protein
VGVNSQPNLKFRLSNILPAIVHDPSIKTGFIISSLDNTLFQPCEAFMTAHIFILYHITKNEDDKAKKPANQYGDDGEKHSPNKH